MIKDNSIQSVALMVSKIKSLLNIEIQSLYSTMEIFIAREIIISVATVLLECSHGMAAGLFTMKDTRDGTSTALPL